jgi:hypothetical protein
MVNRLDLYFAEPAEPPKAVPFKPASYVKSDRIAAAWIVSLVVASLLGFIAGRG